MEIYNQIFSETLNNYDIRNTNYNTILNVKELINNNELMQKLKEINQIKNLDNKINKLIDIYELINEINSEKNKDNIGKSNIININNIQKQNMMMQNSQMFMMQNFMNQRNLFIPNIYNTRIQKEFYLCVTDTDLIQIGASFGLVNKNDYSVWRATIVGPGNTPYEGGLFTLIITFPQDYPNHGADIKFATKIFHLNIYSDGNNELMSICVPNLNSWRISGKVHHYNEYTIKHALIDIFCILIQPSLCCSDHHNWNLFHNNLEQYNAEAKKWTELYAKF